MNSLLLLATCLSSLAGFHSVNIELGPRQMSALVSGHVITQDNLVFKLTQSGSIMSETKPHFEYLKMESRNLTTALARRAFSFSRSCNGHFAGWEHDDLWRGFNAAVEAFWKPHDQSFTVATFISGNHVTACIKMHCYNCNNLDALRGLAYQAWAYSSKNKCDQNETQGTEDPDCRCRLDYSWGAGCPKSGTYWE
ncbi:hypothetical protein DSO57_1011105 [Entomophthora muscae]|uniref:Uncharacterized protein n=1 Tax=Entomophthora muscae TaxID=34485 RepID=A0ACC2T6T0_9FUNG|nr:hypothetical protein DSO57_1011105 [Entomophthora muscae]